MYSALGVSVYSHSFKHTSNINLQRKATIAYIYIGHYLEIVSSGQRSRAFESATITVQLVVKGGCLQNKHSV